MAEVSFPLQQPKARTLMDAGSFERNEFFVTSTYLYVLESIASSCIFGVLNEMYLFISSALIQTAKAVRAATADLPHFWKMRPRSRPGAGVREVSM